MIWCLLTGLVLVGCVTYVATGTIFLLPLANAGDATNELDADALKKIGVVQVKKLKETSGIDCSYTFPGTMWFHNDSGNSATLYLVRNDGTLAAKCPVKGIKNKDWEDICTFQHDGQSYIVVGDVGDNSEKRKTSRLLLIREPKLELKSDDSISHDLTDVEKISFEYEDGPRDCESIAYDSATESVILIQKRFGKRDKNKSGIYSLKLTDWLADSPPPKSKTAVARRIADFPFPNSTGMDISTDNRSMIIRNYLNAHLFQKADDQSWSERLNSKVPPKAVSVPLERQGEAICFTLDDESYIVTSEHSRQPIWQVLIEKAIQD